ncbi:exonuclease [Streptomyces phage Celia]|uniref:Exonuclease n=1 Tax=Streptomyces phage Celia TaxID=2590946 RepID=A0A516KRC7_9CAUD|nr:exonuclease [Streptomyces phage Celia]QDP44248.1 exonuclease [Streptomyces phage Celia]QFG10508.1 metallophosphoesterase [Streptomyces phage Urza]QJD50610.1 metallophosphoesterase [Streptomyces phage Itza]
MTSLKDELLAKPVGPAVPARQTNPEKDFTRQIEVNGDTAAVTVKGPANDVDEDAATAYLRAQGLDPADWTATGFRSSEWTMPNGDQGVSTRFTFARAATVAADDRPPLDELLAAIEAHVPATVLTSTGGEHTFIVALGDMQFGKIDGDGVEGTLARTVDCINKAADLLEAYRLRFDIGHVHIAWLGDHVEGFVSQGGANTWRTVLTLNEQIRLTRRVMLHALLTFAPRVARLTMAAVPGNHGEAVRFMGKGVTRYDDSHDTESLIAVADAAGLNPERFSHVEFFVPETDELTVVVECSGTVVAHAHGHAWRPGKHFDWWRGQAFDARSAMHQADLLLAGHLHHEHTDTDGPRTFVQPPAMESESTWWRHAKGTRGAPGLMVLITKDGATPIKEVVTQ